VHVEYQITPDDLYAFHWRAFYKSPVLKRSRWKPVLILFAGFLVFAVLPAIGGGGFDWRVVSWPYLVIVFPITVLLYRAIERSMVKRAIRALVSRERPDRGQLGRHTIRLVDEGFEESTAVGQSRTFWAGIDRIEQDDAYIYVYTAVAAAHVIPKRAFKGHDAQLFFERVKARAGEPAAPRFGD
jgi:hypothetical protein